MDAGRVGALGARWALCVLSAACGFHGPQATGAPDGPAGPAIDGSDPALCFDQGLVAICLPGPPAAAVTLADTAIDTDGDARCLVGETATCTIAGTSVTITGTVTAHGTRPLVVLATGAIDVAGTLDLSSTVGGARGAAADTAPCSAATTPQDGTGGAGAGAGGSFGDVGSSGAAGNLNGTTHPGGLAGAAVAIATLTGGCPGELGATGNAAGGMGGHSGGAVYLGAKVAIAIEGAVFASGAGGGGGGDEAGGGGGGSGGLIGLDAPTITVGGILASNGGAGGGGGGAFDPTSGGPGEDGSTRMFAVPARGGAPGFDTGSGGTGSTFAVPHGTTPVTGDGGGGGGGGSVGAIWVRGAFTGTQVSPAPGLH